MIDEYELILQVLKQGYIWLRIVGTNDYKCVKVYQIYIINSPDKPYDFLQFMLETEQGDYLLDGYGSMWELKCPNINYEEKNIVEKSLIDNLFTDILDINIDINEVDLMFAKQEKCREGHYWETGVWKLASKLIEKGWIKK